MSVFSLPATFLTTIGPELADAEMHGTGSSCANWGTGTMDLTSKNTKWIWAFKNGDPIKSDSNSLTTLSQHDSFGKVNFDLSVAAGGNSLNPFATQTTASGTTSSGSSPTSTAASGSGDVGAVSVDDGSELKNRNKAMIAHGVVMGLAFAFVFPLGSILIRIFSFPGLLWVHAGTQLFAYLLSIVGLGLGIYIALKPERGVCLFSPVRPL